VTNTFAAPVAVAAIPDKEIEATAPDAFAARTDGVKKTNGNA